MDSNPLERERGITILAKNTSVMHHNGVKIHTYVGSAGMLILAEKSNRIAEHG